jgi:Domain of unknown function (DUF4153)
MSTEPAGQLAQRWQLSLFGALGGLALWAAVNAAEREALSDKPAFVLVAAILVLFGAALAMAGPLRLKRALVAALGLAVLVSLLVWASLARHPTIDGLFASPVPALAGLLVALLPIPYVIAWSRGNWRDYGVLFLEAWSIVVRSAAAWLFVGVVWLVILLSDQVLQIVGITVIGSLLELWSVPLILTGAIFGLGMAVVYELADLLSPYLVLRLFRLLLPVVLVVMLVFLVALPFRGLGGLFNGLSPALLLLAMVGGGIGLVSIAVDQNDAEAPQSLVIRRAAQGMSLVLPVTAALAAWAIWQRVAQYGWTPDRLFVSLVAGLGLAYGGLYAGSVLRGRDWMAHIRQANVGLALVILALAVLWLSPILNAERLSAESQLSRFDRGLTPVEDLDLVALGRWGHAGEAALAALAERAKEPGQEALAARLAGEDPVSGPEARTAALAGLASALSLQPPSASGTRDTLLAAAADYQLFDWGAVCDRSAATGEVPCVMVVADLLPAVPGEEAILMVDRGQGYIELAGLYLAADGSLATRMVTRADGQITTPEELRALMETWSTAPPPLTPAPFNQVGTGGSGLFILP